MAKFASNRGQFHQHTNAQLVGYVHKYSGTQLLFHQHINVQLNTLL